MSETDRYVWKSEEGGYQALIDRKTGAVVHRIPKRNQTTETYDLAKRLSAETWR